MAIIPFIPKSHPDLPDHYGITIFYVNGNTETLTIATHSLIEKVMTDVLPATAPDGTPAQKPVFSPIAMPYLEIWTKDDLCSLIPLSSVQRIEFDKNFSKMCAIRDQMQKNPPPTK